MSCCRISTDRNEAGLRGPVHLCSTEHDVAYTDEHWISRIEEMFSKRGELLQRRHRNPNGTQWVVICRYDDQGRLREKEHRGEELQDLYVYHYDALSRLECVIQRSPRHGERIFESFLYASDGTKTQTTYPPPLDDKERMSTAVSSDAQLHLSVDAVVIMTVFDRMDRPLRKVLYDADDRVIRRTQFLHDQRGLLIEEGELVGGRIRDDFRNIYRYDDLGRRIEADKSWGFGAQRSIYVYNEHGDVVEERTEQRSELKLEHRAHESWTQRYQYEYDERQNWTVRLTDGVCERRQLTYY